MIESDVPSSSWGQGRFFITKDCESLQTAFSDAVWNKEVIGKDERCLLYTSTKYKDTGIRIRDYGRGVAVLQNTNTMETVMLAENIVDMVDNYCREKGESPVGPPLSESGQEGIYWQNETCTLRCMTVIAQEETKEEFLLKKLEEYDFEEKRKRIC